MAEPRPSYQRFFADLKRRKVFRAVAVYGAVSFGVIQVADPVGDALRLPEWFLPAILGLLLLGFPIVVAMAWALEVTPEGVRRSRKAEPEELERIASQSRARRWGAGLLAVAGVVALVAGAWFAGRSMASATAAGPATEAEADGGPPERSIAVLPFADMSPSGDQEYFSDGISEELLNLLAKVPELRVAARTSSFAFKGENVEVPEIGEALNVAHVLEGSVRKAGERIRVTAQLIRADDGYHVWSETWNRTLDDIFAIQDEIAADVVDQLRITLLDEAPTVEETDTEAYALVLRARHALTGFTQESPVRAERLLEEALAIDPDYAPAWVELAAVRYRYAGLGAPWDSIAPHVEEAANRALEIDPRNARAHGALGALALHSGELREAARHHSRALALDPGDARVIGSAATVLMALNRLEESRALMLERIRRDPVSVAGHQNLGLLEVALRRFEPAEKAFRTALELAPDASGIRSMLGSALLYQGRPETGLAATLDDNAPVWQALSLVEIYHELGRHEESDERLRWLIDNHARGTAFNIAYVVAYRGEVDRAFEWLDRAIEYEDPGLAEIWVWPGFDTLEDDPRWDAFLERIGRSPDQLDGIEFEVRLPQSR
jgi:TolB-like protein/thioredoxin-like negative regulator of GroEL